MKKESSDKLDTGDQNDVLVISKNCKKFLMYSHFRQDPIDSSVKHHQGVEGTGLGVPS